MKQTNLLKITYAQMSHAEREQLQKKFKFLIPMGVFILLVLGLVNYGMGLDFFTLLIDTLFVVAFVSIYRAFHLDLKENEKKIWQGVITNKHFTVKSNKDSRNTYTYYFYFGKQKRSISEEVYNQFNVGDLIEVHLAKRAWGVYFDTKLLKENAMSDTVAQYQNQVQAITKNSRKMGCVVFLIFGVLISIWFLLFSGIIDPSTIPIYLQEIFESME